MQISRTVMYALQATVVLSKSDLDVPVPCRTLSQHGQMPQRFLVQVLRNLVTHGVLRSTLGAGGGYVLARPPSEISLLQIVDALDNSLDLTVPIVPGVVESLRERVQLSVSRSSAAGRKHLE